MRVLVAGLRGIPDVEGGVESHAQCLYPIVSELGCEVEIIVRRPFHDRTKSNRWGNIKLIPLWSPKRPGAESLVHSLLATVYAIWSRPDVFHLHAIGPSLWVPLARMFGINVVVTHHGPDYDREKWGWLGKYVLKLGEQLGMRFANRRIVISQTIRRLVENNCGRDSEVIPNGVNSPALTTSTELLEKLELSSGKYIVQVSRFVPEKRQTDLIRAFLESGLEDWQLLFVGRFDPDLAYCREVELLAKGDSRIVFSGFRSGTELTELFQNAGLFVLPSSHEGLPIALLEALSFGLRVLASDIPANLEIDLKESCYFPLGDTIELGRRLHSIASEPISREESAARRKWVLERYSWTSIAKRTVEIYQDSLSRS